MSTKINLTFFENSMLQDFCELELKRIRRDYDKAGEEEKKYIDAVACILVNLLMKLRDEL